jgi:hypothetical protein
MNYHSRRRPLTPRAENVPGNTYLPGAQSVERGWKIFGDYMVPLYVKETEKAGSNSSSGATSHAEQRHAPINVLAPRSLINLKQASQNASFYAIQEWEGYVSSIDDIYLYADLIDLIIDEKRPSTYAKIPIVEIPEDELKLAIPGSIFRWSIGYRRSAAGQKDRVSRIRFRLLKSRPRFEIEAIDKQTKTIENYFSKID